MQRHDVIFLHLSKAKNAFNGEFWTQQQYFLMKITSFNMQDKADKIEHLCIGKCIISHHVVASNRSNIIPALLPYSAEIKFILPDLCDVDKFTHLFLYDNMIKS